MDLRKRYKRKIPHRHEQNRCLPQRRQGSYAPLGSARNISLCVENYSSKDAADLRDYVIDELKGKGIDIDKALEKYAKQGPYDTREKQISELVADSMFLVPR